MRKISVLGCGWLGFPLATNLILDGFAVNGSTTTLSKLQLFASHKISPFLIELSPDTPSGEITSFLTGTETLIIDVPPKMKSGESFEKKIEMLVRFIEESPIKNVLFISSTSVYADENQLVTEHSITKPDSESGKQLLLAEHLLQRNSCFKTTIVRFGGLIGPDRHPITSLSGKQNLPNPNAPVNLIHQQDCIDIILQIINKGIWGEIFNAAAPFHPIRAEYYRSKAIETGLEVPGFDYTKISKGKTISSELLCKKLDYKFRYPNL